MDITSFYHSVYFVLFHYEFLNNLYALGLHWCKRSIILNGKRCNTTEIMRFIEKKSYVDVTIWNS